MDVPKNVPLIFLPSLWYGEGNWNFKSCLKKISCGRFPRINSSPASVNWISGERSTKPNPCGERVMRSRALNAEYFLDVSPSNVVASASAWANSSCTRSLPLHVCPENLSTSKSISGINFLGDLGEVVKNQRTATFNYSHISLLIIFLTTMCILSLLKRFLIFTA